MDGGGGRVDVGCGGLDDEEVEDDVDADCARGVDDAEVEDG